MIWFQNPAQLDFTMLNYYFTVVISFFFHITHTQSSPLVFCVNSSSILISSLVFFVSFPLVWVSSVVVLPSCFASQPIASCGSSRDTTCLCFFCLLFDINDIILQRISNALKINVGAWPDAIFFILKDNLYPFRNRNNYTISTTSTENLEDHYVLKHLSTVNSDFKAILWVHRQLDCQFLSTFTQKSPASRNRYFIFKAFNGPSSHSLLYHHKSIPSKLNIKASIFTQWEHWMNTASKQF